MVPPHICSMCIKTNQVGKEEVGIWWVQKRLPRNGVPIWSLWPNIRLLSSIVAEKMRRKMCIYVKCVYHIGTPYRGKRFWTHQIPTSCLPTLLIFIHIEHICSFFWANIDGRNLIFRHKLHIGNIRFVSSIVAEKNVTKNVHIHACSMCIKTN
jgi:hypothetical protein